MLQTLTIRLRRKVAIGKNGGKLLDLVGEREEELRGEGALSKSNKRKEPPFLSDMSTVFENYIKSLISQHCERNI